MGHGGVGQQPFEILLNEGGQVSHCHRNNGEGNQHMDQINTAVAADGNHAD